MYLLFDLLLVVLGAAMLLYRKPLGRYMAQVQQYQARAWPWMYPGRLGQWYASERAWRGLFIPAFAFVTMLLGLLWLWKGAY